MKILFPERIADRHVGGNTTYTRELIRGIESVGEETGRLGAAKYPALTAVAETIEGLRKREEDVVLHYTADTGPLLGTRAPTVVTVHGVASRWIDGVRSNRAERVWRTRVGRAIEAADVVITVSKSSQRDVAEVFGVAPEKIRVIHHGINIDAYSTPTAISSEIGASLPSDFVLYVGNIEPRKNIESLIEACALIGRPLVIAGKPAWNFASIMRKVENAPHVTMLGFVSESDKVALMQRCAAFAFPSRYEGFGFPVLEAMAADAEVVTSSRGSLAEVAGPATLVEDLEPTGIASSLAQALSVDRSDVERIRQRRRWVERFTWDSSIEAHLTTYREVLQ